MTKAQAYEILDLEEGVPIEQIRGQFKHLYNEYKILINEAPIENFRKKYEEQLDRIEQAYKLLTDNESIDELDDLPTIASNESIEQHWEFEEKNTTVPTEKVGIIDDGSNLSDLRNAYKILQISPGAPTAKVILEYQRQRAELISLIAKRSGKIVDEAKKELATLEKAIFKINPKISQQDLYPEQFGKTTFSLRSKLTKKVLFFFIVIISIIALVFILSELGAFKPDHQTLYEQGEKLFMEAKLKEAEEVFTELLDTPLEGKARTFLEEIEKTKIRLLELERESFNKFVQLEDYITAEAYYKKMENIMSIEDYDKELFFEWLKLKDEVPKQKKQVEDLLLNFDNALKNSEYSAAEQYIEEAHSIHTTSKLIPQKKEQLQAKIKQEKNCQDKIESVRLDLMFVKAGTESHAKALKEIDFVIENCPWLEEAAEIKRKLLAK
jgi:hypothetical protein